MHRGGGSQIQYHHGGREAGVGPQEPTGRHIGVQRDEPYDGHRCHGREYRMQANGSKVGFGIDGPVYTERSVLLARDDEARGSEEAKGQTLHPLRFSDGRRQIPSANQETESPCTCQDESEGGIHEHEFFAPP